MTQSMEYTFWPAPVRLHPFEDHVKAAAAGGFTALAIAPTTYFDAVRRGLTGKDMKAMAEDRGVPLRNLDTLTTWAPFELADEFDEEMNARWSTSLDRALDACAELGLTQILATAAYRKNGVPLQQLVDGFGGLCDRAGAYGIWIDLEPMPFFGCDTVTAAWDIVRNSDSANSGILMDTWHFYKAGCQTLDVIDDIPGWRFRTMQINDAPLAQISASLFEDTIKHRRFPGQGELPVTDFIRAVYAKGGLTSIGQEVFCLEADAMTPEDAGRLAGRTTFEALTLAGVPVPEVLAVDRGLMR
jgi:sugar phosphate isomerase/epimerase